MSRLTQPTASWRPATHMSSCWLVWAAIAKRSPHRPSTFRPEPGKEALRRRCWNCRNLPANTTRCWRPAKPRTIGQFRHRAARAEPAAQLIRWSPLRPTIRAHFAPTSRLRPRPVRLAVCPLRGACSLRIIQYPHPTLRHVSKPLKRVDAELHRMIREMFELMYEPRGSAWPPIRSTCPTGCSC